MAVPDPELLREELVRCFPVLTDARIEAAHAFVHDVLRCTDPTGNQFAVKLYRAGVRTRSEVEWEAALAEHLHARGAPVAELISGSDGPVGTVPIDGVRRHVTVSRWVSGSKPAPTVATYRLLGDAAARIHAAADSFDRERPATAGSVTTLLDTPLAAIADLVEGADRVAAVAEIRAAIHIVTGATSLDRGVCHNDLTLDNVHIDGDRIYVFDLDSAGRSWRAMEPAGVYAAWARARPDRWGAWLEGYRTVRDFSDRDEAAVPWLSLMSEIEIVVWKLGRTPTSVGQLLTPSELPTVIDGWLEQCRRCAMAG